MSQQIESVKMALQELGINASGEFYYNPDYDLLIAHETSPELTGAARGVMTDSGAVAVDTGIFTGRSPRDKYIVRDEQTRDTVWWADSGLGRNDNKPLSPDVWRSLKSLVAGQLSGKKLYVIDAWCYASPDTRLGVRFVTEVAWQAHFVKNMFIVPSADELASFTPDFVVLNGAGCTNANWQAQGMNSENFVAFNLSERIQLIGGHLVRRRNEERAVLGHELPAAAERHRVDALLGQPWRSRGRGAVLRPLRDRENHPVDRSASSADRR